jgi:hypothetical protein
LGDRKFRWHQSQPKEDGWTVIKFGKLSTWPHSMDSLNTSDALTQLQNLDPASKAEIEKVIEQESQKAELQKSIFPRFQADQRLTLNRYSQTG